MNELGDIAIAQRACRLRSLQHLHDELLDRMRAAGSPDLVDLSKELRGVLEQAAKEVGSMFTNVSRSESTSVVATLPVSIEDKRYMLAERIAEAMRKALPAPDSV